MKWNKSWPKKNPAELIHTTISFSYRKYKERKIGRRQKWKTAMVISRRVVLWWSLQTNHDYSKQTWAYQQLFKQEKLHSTGYTHSTSYVFLLTLSSSLSQDNSGCREISLGTVRLHHQNPSKTVTRCCIRIKPDQKPRKCREKKQILRNKTLTAYHMKLNTSITSLESV